MDRHLPSGYSPLEHERGEPGEHLLSAREAGAVRRGDEDLRKVVVVVGPLQERVRQPDAGDRLRGGEMGNSEFWHC